MVRNHSGDDEEEVSTENLPEYKDQVRSHISSNNYGIRNMDPPAVGGTDILRNSKPPPAVVVDSEQQQQQQQQSTTPHQATTEVPMAQAIPLARYIGSAHNSNGNGENDNDNYNVVDNNVIAPVVVATTKATKRSESNHDDSTVFVLKVSRTTCIWSMTILLLLGAVIGGFCGAGKCGGSSSSGSSNSSRTTDQSINSGSNNDNNNSTTPSAPPSTFNVNNPSMTISATESYLRSISLLSNDSEQIFIDAENLAVQWMEQKNTTIMDLSDPIVQFKLQQQFVLANMYYSSTNPGAWINETNWLSHLDECQWHGMTCTQLTFDEELTNTTTDPVARQAIDDLGFAITALHFGSNNIRGPISPNIGLLTNLLYLDLSNNLITGTIPSTLSYCSQLLEVKIHDNLLTGSLPSELGTSWRMLEHFVAYSNSLMVGSIPDTYSGWTNVHTVDISGMGITGTLPDSVLSKWTNMYDFYCAWNKMTGTLPGALSAWKSIEYFSVEANQFNGTIPSSIGLWTNLREIRLRENLFTGTIPSTISSWRQIETVNFEINFFAGTIPEAVCNISSLTVLTTDLPCSCCTNETSTITDEPTPSPPFVMDVENYIMSVAPNGGNVSSPTMDAEIQAIDWLIHNNEILQLQAWDPVGQFRLKQRYALLTLYFGTSNETSSWSNNDQWLNEPDECLWYGISCLITEPEPGLGNQSVVEAIKLDSNGLRGMLSPDLSLLNKLSILLLQHNDISGSLPSELGSCGCLTEFRVSNNSLTGILPSEYGETWLNLYVFEAWQNQFTGTIPVSYGSWSNLILFDVDANQLTGMLPGTISNWKNMEYFYVAMNNLTGTIPANFGNSTPNMLHFGVSENGLSGTISSTYGTSWTRLELFHISNNPFTGTIPATISNWKAATVVDVGGTNLTGAIPDDLCNVTTITYLGADSDSVSCSCCTCCGY